MWFQIPQCHYVKVSQGFSVIRLLLWDLSCNHLLMCHLNFVALQLNGVILIQFLSSLSKKLLTIWNLPSALLMFSLHVFKNKFSTQLDLVWCRLWIHFWFQELYLIALKKLLWHLFLRNLLLILVIFIIFDPSQIFCLLQKHWRKLCSFSYSHSLVQIIFLKPSGLVLSLCLAQSLLYYGSLMILCWRLTLVIMLS